MKQDSALLNQLWSKDEKLLRDFYKKLKDLESAIAEYVLTMRKISKLVTELKDKTKGEAK